MNALDLVQAAVLGLGTGLALIIAIGVQNAFVLRQGIRREHVGVVVALCMVSDALLILGGNPAYDAPAELGLEPGGMAPEELTALMRAEIPRLGKVVRASGAKVD